MANFLRQTFMAICLAATFAMTMMIIGMIGPEIETRYFPAVSKLTILSIKPGANNDSVIMTQFRKLRSCEFMGLSWYHKLDDDAFDRVFVQLLRKTGDSSSPNRPQGVQRAGPWIIGMPPKELLNNSVAILSHRCHGLWLTTTKFYP